MTNILVVDDEKEICELVEIYLRNEGYSVYKAYNGIEALDQLREEQIHLMILDIMMPGMDGIEFCRKVREDSDIPIIMLSAKGQDNDKILGLLTGADDYMTKPFNPFELIARIKSQLRRYSGFGEKRKEEELCYGGLVLNKSEHTVMLYENAVELTPIEFDILQILMSGEGKVFSSEEIFETVWKEKYFDSNNTVMVHIRHIREKLKDDSKNPTFIKTVWGVGYKI